MSVNLSRLRRTFTHAAQRMGWSDADQAEYGADIKAAIDASDLTRLLWWQEFLEQCSDLSNLAAQCRAMEARIHAAAIMREMDTA